MPSLLHKAATRGHANHGWLESYHSFSFANYFNPERMQFGALRVLNDDTVAAGMGFGTHPHKNMEIISIPLEGDLEHKDSMGNTAVIRSGDIQVLSAGTGITHSEYNKNSNQQVKFLQIWVLPNKQNVPPRYDQMRLDVQDRKNKLQQVVSPSPADAGVWIHQAAWFHMSQMDEGTSLRYDLKAPKTNGVYAFVLGGEVQINEQQLVTRDGYGVWEVARLNLKATKDTELLLLEVPMFAEN